MARSLRRRQWWPEEGENLGELVLEGLLIAEDGCLVGQDCAHVSSKGLQILADEDAVLLGLFLVGLETSCEVEHWILEDSGGTDRVLLLGRLWRWGRGGEEGGGGGGWEEDYPA